MRLTFRFRWVPAIATICVMAIGLSLGNWQTRRAEEKTAIEQAMQARAALPAIHANTWRRGDRPDEYRRIVAEGEFIAAWPIYLENRPQDGKAGFHLLMPLRLTESGDVVLVLRGWLPRDPLDRQRIPPVLVPAGSVHIEGRVRDAPGQVMQLGEAPALVPGAIVQNLTTSGFATASRLPLHTFIIEQSSDSGDGLVRDWPQPSAGIATHRGYAFQWYALSAAALIFFLVTGYLRGRSSKP